MVAPDCISLLLSHTISIQLAIWGGGGGSCTFAKVFDACVTVGIFFKIRDFDHFTAISK